MPSASPTPSQPACARPGGVPDDLEAVWQVITGMYQAYMAGDRARVDAFLDREATVFDSDIPELVCGKAELDGVRDRRPTTPSGPLETGLEAHGEVIDVFGDLALVRYWLRVGYRALPSRMIRNTAVLRRGQGGWRIVHLHEDVRAQTSRP